MDTDGFTRTEHGLDAFSVTQFRSADGCLSYVVRDQAAGAAMIIDASRGIPLPAYLHEVKVRNSELAYLLETHTHADHISALPELRERFPKAPVIRHGLSPYSKRFCAVWGGEHFELGKGTFDVIAAPGHSPDGIVVRIGDAVFTGDTLFIHGSGRTDLKESDPHSLFRALGMLKRILGEDDLIFPGHGYAEPHSARFGELLRKNQHLSMDEEEFVKKSSAKRDLPKLYEEALRANA